MQTDLEQVIQYFTYNKGTYKFTMGTKPESIKCNHGADINKKKTETKLRTYESHRVSQGILQGILNKMHKEIVTQHHTLQTTKVKNKANADTCGRKEIPMKRPTSMSSLIIWNISKALEMNPYMDLKSALNSVWDHVENDPRDVNAVISQYPDQQHLVCAMLAWQQLGNIDADSLYKFIEAKKKEVEIQSPGSSMKIYQPISKDKSPPRTFDTSNESSNCCPKLSKCSGSFGSHSSGPVVKLPVDTKLIMRCDNPGSRQMTVRVQKEQDKDTMKKINAACCLDSVCVERLATLDATTKELRMRASKLARREAERVELLERAEIAWRDLELGYQRRLTQAEEKEEDINKQIQKLIADRNVYKNGCATLSSQLKARGDVAENERAKLTEVEKHVCDRACIKLRLSEDAAKGEAILAEHQCKAAQLDRDLQFKEEQARRKLVSLENEADSARALTHEAERAMRAELSGLREQIAQVSNELLQEDELNVRIKAQHEQLRQEKNEIVEDLEGCKVMCDLRMQGRLDELQKKKDLLNGLKDQVMECRCKMPVDVMVEVKRTPSLAALCRCAPEDRLLESCSCTSLRGRLLSNLLADLFGGLQTELSGSGSQMPCQLLKCLEDKHNWDRASVVKTNLRNFFSKLLMGELDIAIATAIENYHAKWVGASCADAAKMVPEPEDELTEGWQQRALERRAQKLATQLAEQLFQERAELLTQRARDIVTSGPPPCECKPPTSEAAVYPCLMQSNMPLGGGLTVVNPQSSEAPAPAYWKRTIQDVTQLRLQIEDLQKESIKKEDLKIMENKIANIVKQASATGNEDTPIITKDTSDIHGKSSKKETKILKLGNRDESPKSTNATKSGVTRKKPSDSNSVFKKLSLNDKNRHPRKLGHGQAYAVNLCLCGPQKNNKNAQNAQFNNDGKSSWKQKPSRDIIPQNSSVKQTKPINVNLPSPDIAENNSKTSAQPSCKSDCKCFRKVPSNTSIDKLLETLAKWKCDLADPQEKCIKNIKSSFSKYSKSTIKDSMRFDNQNDTKINLSISTEGNKEQANETGNSSRKLQKEIDSDTRSAHLTQPATTVSEYMGAVNLDKSNENICKCINKIEFVNESNKEKDNNNTPFKCINSNPCECRIYREMQQDNNRLQNKDHNKVDISNNFQSIQTEDITDIKKSSIINSNHVNNQNELERTSDINNVTQKTELFPSNCDYYIKFLGVTLDDISSHKKTKKVIKNGGNTEDLLISKDKYGERRKKRSKKLSKMETSNSFNKANVITVEENYHSGLFHRPSKCECNSKLEEFKKFMTNVFIKQLQANTFKDECLDSQSFKFNKNSIESCVCCNSVTMDDSKDLEVNAFHLLEDHLKGKLEEFKSFSCKSSCIPPEEEEKLFSAILKRVKQVISDCANEMKCNCPGSLQSDGSWNRAYGLLQEYLKIKIKRVQCLCVINEKKDVILPDILDKVCTLIENDFQRLKDICKCQNTNEINKNNVRIEDLVLPVTEVPEKDTNTSNTKYDIVEVQTFPAVKKISKQNSNRSMILMENISSQVPPNLGMEAKSCEITQLDNNNAQTTETETIVSESKSNGVMYNKCDCCYNTEKAGSGQYLNRFATKEVLVNLYADAMKNTNDISELPENDLGRINCVSIDRIDSLKTLLDKKITENMNSKGDEQKINEQDTQLSYSSNTADCTCGRPLGSCICIKSLARSNNDKIDSIWKEFLANNCNKDFSYIMTGSRKKDHVDIKDYHTSPGDVVVDVIPESDEQSDDKRMCEAEVNAYNEDEVVLKNSHNNLNTIHHTTNTFEENFSLGISCSNSESPLDWFEYPAPINSDAGSSSVKLTTSIYYPAPIINGTRTADPIKTYQNCDCNRVPICHVKMLVENIEKNLIESKCTCDSLISKVCPVHSKK